MGLGEALWLCPIEGRRRLDSTCEGMIEGFLLGNDLLLADYAGRLSREEILRCQINLPSRVIASSIDRAGFASKSGKQIMLLRRSSAVFSTLLRP